MATICLNYKTSASGDAEQLELLYVADGNAKSFSHFGRQAVSYKVTHTLPVQPSNSSPKLKKQKQTKNICTQKNLYTVVYVDFTHNLQKLQINRMSISSKWIYI